jgi:MarR family transcriptional regulator for hemolysin
MQVDELNDLDVLSTPGHLISVAARGFARLSEARLKPLGFGIGYLPVLIALKNGRARTQRDLARFAKIEQPSMAQMLARMERDGWIGRAPDPADGRSHLISLTERAEARLPDACAVLFQGNREALGGFSEGEAALLVSLLIRLTANLDRLSEADQPGGAPLPRVAVTARCPISELRRGGGNAVADRVPGGAPSWDNFRSPQVTDGQP